MALLHNIIKAHNLLALQKALETTSPNEVDEHGWSALHYAFTLDYPDMVEILIASGADCGLTSTEGDTPIELGLIFMSMGCLRLVQHVLTEEPRYKTLIQYEKRGMEIKQNKKGYEKYHAYAELAVQYVQETGVKAYNIPGKTDWSISIAQNNALHQYKRIVNTLENISALPDGGQFFYNYISAKSKIGNCGAQSAIAYLLCRRIFGLRKAELIEGKSFDMINNPYTALFPSEKDGEHVALLLGKGEGDPCNEHYLRWGETAVICDPWASSVYSSIETEVKFKLLLNGPHQLIDFEPKYHNLVFLEYQHQLRLPLLPNYSNYKKMNNVEKIAYLKEHMSKVSREDSEGIKRVIEHKEMNSKRLYAIDQPTRRVNKL